MSNDSESETHKPKIHHSWWGSLAGRITAVLTILASIATIITVVPIVQAFLQREPITEFQRTPQLALEFWDGTKNEQYPMTSEEMVKNGEDITVIHVTAKPGPFEIRFPTLKEDVGGMHICAWTDDSIFSIRDGTDFSHYDPAKDWVFDSPFVPGKGIANTEAGNAELPITNEYNSYWGGSRVEHISETKDKVFLSKGVWKQKVEPFSKWKSNLYLAIWTDSDNDKSIDYSEYEYIVLDFAK